MCGGVVMTQKVHSSKFAMAFVVNVLGRNGYNWLCSWFNCIWKWPFFFFFWSLTLTEQG